MSETLLTINTVLSSGAVIAAFRGRYSAGASIDELLIVRPNCFQIYGVECTKSADSNGTPMEVFRPLLAVELIVSIDRACHIPAISFANQTFSQDLLLLVSNTLHISLYGFYGNSQALNYVELLNVNLAFYLATEGRVPLPIPKKYTMSLAAVSVVPNMSALICFSYRDSPTIAGQLVFIYLFNSTLGSHSSSKKAAHKTDEHIHASIILPNKNVETSQVVDIKQVCFLESPPLYERSGETMLPVLCVNGNSDICSFELCREPFFSCPQPSGTESRITLVKQGIKLMDGPFCMRDLPFGSVLCPVHFYIESSNALTMYFPLAVATCDSFSIVLKMRDSYSISFRSANHRTFKSLHPQAVPLSVIQIENSHIFLIAFDDGNLCYVYVDVGQLFKVANDKREEDISNTLTTTETIYSDGVVTHALRARIFTTGVFTWPSYGKEGKMFRLPSSIHLACIRKRRYGLVRSRGSSGKATISLLEAAAFATAAAQQDQGTSLNYFQSEENIRKEMEFDEVLIFLGSQTLDSTITRVQLSNLCKAHSLNVECGKTGEQLFETPKHEALYQLDLINQQLIQGVGAVQDLSHIEGGLILTASSHGRDGNLALMEKGMLVRNMGDTKLPDMSISNLFFYHCPIGAQYYIFLVPKTGDLLIYQIKLASSCVHGNLQKQSQTRSKKPSQLSVTSTKSILGLLQTTTGTSLPRDIENQSLVDFVPVSDSRGIPSLTEIDFETVKQKHPSFGILLSMNTISVDTNRHITIRLYRGGVCVDNSILYKFSSSVLSGKVYKEYIVASGADKSMFIMRVRTDTQPSTALVMLNKYTDVHISAVYVDTLDASKNLHAAFFGMQNKTLMVYAFDNCNTEVTSLNPIKVPIVPFSILLLLSDTPGKHQESSNTDKIEGKLLFSGLDGYIGVIPFEISQKKSKRAYTYTLTTSKINTSTILKSREGKVPLQLYHIMDSSTSFMVRGSRLFYATISKEIDLTITKAKGEDDVNWRINVIRMVTRPLKAMVMVVPLPTELQKLVFNHIESNLITPYQCCIETCDEMTRASVYGMTTRTVNRCTDLQAQTLNTFFLVLLNGQLEMNSRINTIHTPLGASVEVLHGDAGQYGAGMAVNSTFGYHTVHRAYHKSSKIASAEVSEDHKAEYSDAGKQVSDVDASTVTVTPWSRYIAILLPTTEMQMSITRYLLRRTPLQIEHDAILNQRNHFALHTEQYLSKSQIRLINISNFTVTNKIILGTGLICVTFKTFSLNGTIYLVASLFAGIDIGLLQTDISPDIGTGAEKGISSNIFHEKAAVDISTLDSDITSADTPAMSTSDRAVLDQFPGPSPTDAEVINSNKIKPQGVFPRLVFWVVHESMHYQCVGILPLPSICNSIIVDKNSSTEFCTTLVCVVGNSLTRYFVHATPELPIELVDLPTRDQCPIKSVPLITLENAAAYANEQANYVDVDTLSSAYPELLNTEKQSLFFKIPSQLIGQYGDKDNDAKEYAAFPPSADEQEQLLGCEAKARSMKYGHDPISTISSADVSKAFTVPRSNYELNVTTANSVPLVDKFNASTIVMLDNDDKTVSIACVINNGIISLYDFKLNLLFYDEKGICADVKIVSGISSSIAGVRFKSPNCFTFIAITRENMVHFVVANLEDAFIQVRSMDSIAALVREAETRTDSTESNSAVLPASEKTSRVTILASYPSRHNITCVHSYMNDLVHMGTDSGAVVSIKANATQLLAALQNKMISVIAEKFDLSGTAFDPGYLKKLSSHAKECKVIDADILSQFLMLNTELQGTIARSLNMTVEDIEEALTEIYYL